MIYSANYTVRGRGTSMLKSITDTNKKRLLADIKIIAEGETPYGGSTNFYILDDVGREVYEGFVSKNYRGIVTIRYLVNNYKEIG